MLLEAFKNNLKDKLKKCTTWNVKGNFKFKSRTLNGSQYFSYIVKVDYRDYRSIFKKVLSYLTYVKTPLKYMEKKDIRWFTIDDLERKTLNLRSVFKNTYNEHKENINNYIKET